MDVAAVIAALDTRFDADEAAIAERMLREYVGTMPEQQLIAEIGLSSSPGPLGTAGSVRPARQDSGVSDDDGSIPPALTEAQRIKQRTAAAAAASMFSDPDPESREAAYQQFLQTGDVWSETRDSLNIPDDADPEQAAGLAAILKRIPQGRGRFINCGKGWFGLITELDSVLALLDSDHLVLSVKEKHGRLAYYTSGKYIGFDNAFHRAKQAAQDRSVTVCELCGEPGQMCETGPMGPPGRWVKTLCPACAAAGYRGRSYTPVQGS